MSFFKGLGKVALGFVEAGKSVMMTDGVTTYCPKCGMPMQGFCKSCATKSSSKLISEGIRDIKAADEKVYIDAEKRGYIRASKEYEVVFAEIQAEYNQAKQRFERIIHEKNVHSEQLISQYEQLVVVRKALEAEVERMTKRVAEKSGVSTRVVKNSIFDNAFSSNNSIELLSLLHCYREKKICEAECKGYNRAKREYEKKIGVLKREFEELQSMSNKKIEELHALIVDVLAAISDEQMKIATLKIVE